MGVLAGVAVLAGMPLLLSAEAKAEEPIDQAIDRFASHLLLLWQKDPELSKVAPPQIIANVSANTKVYGGCIDIIANQVRLGVCRKMSSWEVFHSDELISGSRRRFGADQIRQQPDFGSFGLSTRHWLCSLDHTFGQLAIHAASMAGLSRLPKRIRL